MGPSIRRRPNRCTHRPQTATRHSTLRSLRHHIRSQNILAAEQKQDIETKIKDCTACLALGQNLNYQLAKNHYRKLEKLSESGQEIQIDFTGKLHNENLSGETQIAVDIFSGR